ncbi:MAG: TAXI family TRAP transporter solute-binding subunit [Proteobacteria bacterium]|nr:TAXI family TRAP transporter solute-binding subunit [Pseudomonadota bacterium]MDA1324287.1 TAXI family TRAP transporter solute-binding subunit [Pseudomonadota bacterium]
MIMTMKFALSAAAAALAVLSLGASEVAAQGKPDIRIATGRPGGVYFTQGAVLAVELKKSGLVKSASSESSSGAIESARLMEKGTIQVGGMDATWVLLAKSGGKPFKKKIQLATVTPISVAPMFFVTLANSGIKTINDVRGKRLAVGGRGSGMEQHSRKILAALGITFKDIKPVYLSFGPGGRAVREGKADVQLQCCWPNKGLTELAELADARAVSIPQKQLDMITDPAPAYWQMVLPKGAFKGHNRDINTVRITNGWMVTRDSDPQIAYAIAKTVIEKHMEMSKKSRHYASIVPLFDQARKEGASALEVGAPLHPGALRAFKEAGILK